MWWRECRRDGTGFCSTEAIFPRHGRPHPQLPSLGGVQDERATTGLTLVGVPARVGACIWKRHMSHPPWAASCSVLNKLPFVPSSMMYPEEPEYTPQEKRHPAPFLRQGQLFVSGIFTMQKNSTQVAQNVPNSSSSEENPKSRRRHVAFLIAYTAVAVAAGMAVSSMVLQVG